MGIIGQVRDTNLWQKSAELNKLVYQATTKQPFAKDFVLVSQVRSSNASVYSNITLAFEQTRQKDFLDYLHHAEVAAKTLTLLLTLASDMNYVSVDLGNDLLDQTAQILKIIKAYSKYTEATETHRSYVS